jgi:murein DD-endopeptidase MepM/ murein hydrolase activator NlpD
MHFGNTPSLDELVLELDDVNDAPRVAAYVQTVADRQTEIVDRHRRLQEDTTLLEAEAADAKAAVAAEQAGVAARKASLEAARAQQAAVRADVAAEAANEQRLLAQVQARKGDYLAKIRQLERESNDIASQLRRRQAGQKLTPSGHGVLGFPTASAVVTSTFGYRVHPIYGDRRLHAGTDFRAPTGTPVLAAGAGTVVFAGWKSGYGNTVIVDHGGQIATLYGHNSALAVAVGDRVRRGERIASAGSTGNSTGPHVHFEVRVGGTPVDPVKYL